MAITRDDVQNLAMRHIHGTQRRKIALMGIGGVGSNILRQMELHSSGNAFRVSIFDFDTLELHNTNRTSVFSLYNALAGIKKIASIDARAKHFVVQFNDREILPQTDYSFDRQLIIDSRDTMDPAKIIKGTWIKLAYDGGSDIGFTWLPHIVADKIFDLTSSTSNTYAVTPSFYVPAAILAAMTLRFMQFYNFLDITDLRAGTYQCNIDSVINDITYQWEPVDAEEVADNA